MSQRALDTIGGVSGGPVRLAQDPGKARNIHITVANPTAATHLVSFGRSQREVASAPTFGLPGFVVVAVANNVVTSTVAGVAYTSYVLQAWIGELWAIADIANGVVTVDIMDSGYPEK